MNSSVSIGTEQQFSDTSVDGQTGGFLFGIFGEKSGYGAELCLRAFNGNAPHIACYIIKDSINEKQEGKNFELDYSKRDKSGKTLLHHLVYVCGMSPGIVQLLMEVLENTSAKKYINYQDAKGNTCVHYASYESAKEGKEYMNNVVILLRDNGANLSIKNNDKLHVALEKVPVSASPGSIFLTINSDQCDSATKVDVKPKQPAKPPSSDKGINGAIENRIKGLIKEFINKTNQISDDTIGFDRDANTFSFNDLKEEDEDDDDDEIDEDEDDLEDDSSSISDLNSNDVLNKLLDKVRPKDQSQAGGAKKKKTTKSISKKKITGRRKMTTYSEVSFGGSSDDDDSSSDDDDFDKKLQRLARAVNNKASEAHANAVKKIKEILKLDDEDAKAVKAILYEKIKKEHPEYSNADKAMELEKMASDKAILKEIKKTDIKKMIDLIKEKHSAKQSDSQSATSDAPLPRRQSRHLPDESGFLNNYSLSNDDSSSSSSSSSDSSSDSSSGLSSAI